MVVLIGKFLFCGIDMGKINKHDKKVYRIKHVLLHKRSQRAQESMLVSILSKK